MELLVVLLATFYPRSAVAQSQATPTEIPSDPFLTTFNLSSPSPAFFHVAAPSPANDGPTYITLNLCTAPLTILTSPDSIDYNLPSTLIVSNVSAVQFPSPAGKPPKSHSGGVSDSNGGFANVTLFNTEGLWIGVYAPDQPDGAGWGFQLGVSSKAPVHQVNAFPAFRFEDSDATSALLTGADSSLFIPQNATAPPSLDQIFPLVLPTTAQLPLGLSNSLCAIQTFLNSSSASLTVPKTSINASLTTRNTGSGQPSLTSGDDNDYRLSAAGAGRRAQYLLAGLQRSRNYTAWMYQPAGANNGSVGGQWTGRLWPAVNFVTKSSDACRLVFDLPFCPSVAYSIPSPSLLNTPSLISFYETLVSPHLSNFALTMSTFPCQNPSQGINVDGTYSYVATCPDCVSAYTDWVCSVVLPRCTDAPTPGEDLVNPDFAQDQDDNLHGGNQLVLQSPVPQIPQIALVRDNATDSRTPFLVASNLTTAFPNLDAATQIGGSPFPYGEIPPCISLCNYVAATCPPFLQWQCPLSAAQSAASISTLAASYGVARQDLSELEVRGGEESPAGGGGGARAADRFGNVYCNALGSDMTYARMGGAGRLGAGGEARALLVAIASIAVIAWWSV